ncbi:MAG: NADH-quinone oxidoreductase subunit J [Myxococcota bacterium]|nr:NADH-quinone oxidoreductase subunit J [Myxococcota bacterium]
MRLVVLMMAGLLCFGISSSVAQAQTARQPAGQTQTAKPETKYIGHMDRVESPPKSKGMALLFWAFAAATIGGALFVVTRRNMIAAVMGMVGSFLGISAVYMMLYAHFLSVVQMLVYAGAIMVLFIFVIMILNRPEDEPVAPSRRIGAVISGVAILYLVGRLIFMLMKIQPPNPAKAIAAPGITPEGHAWGTVKAVGTDLFGPGLFPFEAISITLLVAVVGAIAIARPMHDDPVAQTDDERRGVDRTPQGSSHP